VAYHPPGRPFDRDVWELYNLAEDFSESEDLAEVHPDRLARMIDLWWAEAERFKVLPLDDRFAARFAENAARVHGARKRFVFHRGMGHVPTDVAPDVRSRSYRIEADVRVAEGDQGVLIAHGDATSGYSLFLRGDRLEHVMNIGGTLVRVQSDRPVEPGWRRLGVAVRSESGQRSLTLLVDGAPAGTVSTPLAFHNFISWSGLDIGLDRGSPVADYPAPFPVSGLLRKVTVVMDEDQALDGEGVAAAEMARQ